MHMTEVAELRDRIAELEMTATIVHHHHHYPPAPTPAFPQPFTISTPNIWSHSAGQSLDHLRTGVPWNAPA
jgi:hypothetical protein